MKTKNSTNPLTQYTSSVDVRRNMEEVSRFIEGEQKTSGIQKLLGTIALIGSLWMLEQLIEGCLDKLQPKDLEQISVEEMREDSITIDYKATRKDYQSTLRIDSLRQKAFYQKE